jgi:hypothetical protein
MWFYLGGYSIYKLVKFNKTARVSFEKISILVSSVNLIGPLFLELEFSDSLALSIVAGSGIDSRGIQV